MRSESVITFYDHISHMSGGKTYVVREKSQMRKYLGIIRAFEDVNGNSDQAIAVHHRVSNISESSGETVGKFTIDSSLGKNTQFGIFVEDAEEHLIKSIVFYNQKGAQFGPFNINQIFLLLL